MTALPHRRNPVILPSSRWPPLPTRSDDVPSSSRAWPSGSSFAYNGISGAASANVREEGLGGGGLAVAILVPVLVTIGVAGVVFWLCLRRVRRRRGREGEVAAEKVVEVVGGWDGNSNAMSSAPSTTAASTTTLAFNDSTPSAAGLTREKSSGSASSRPTQPPRPVTTQTSPLPQPRQLAPYRGHHQNTTYFTGLDTWSLSSGPSRNTSLRDTSLRNTSDEHGPLPSRISIGGTTFADPPPPYSGSEGSHGVGASSLHSHDEVDGEEDDPFADRFADGGMATDGSYGSDLRLRRSVRSDRFSDASGATTPTMSTRAETPRPFTNSADTLAGADGDEQGDRTLAKRGSDPFADRHCSFEEVGR